MHHPLQTPLRLITGLATMILIAGLGACSQDPNSTTAAKNANKAAATNSAPPAKKRDLSTFDVCAQVPAAAVAGIMGSTPEQTSGKATMRTYASDCTYTIQRGEGVRDYAIVWVYAPEMWMPASASTDEKIAGLGDDAYFTQGSGSFKTVHVLVKGDFMLDTRADSAEQARKLAELAFKRLTGTTN